MALSDADGLMFNTLIFAVSTSSPNIISFAFSFKETASFTVIVLPEFELKLTIPITLAIPSEFSFTVLPVKVVSLVLATILVIPQRLVNAPPIKSAELFVKLPSTELITPVFTIAPPN